MRRQGPERNDQMNQEEKTILVTRSSMPSFEEFTQMIRPIWDSAWMTNMGDYHKELERRLKEYMGTDKLVLFVNGHMALEMAIQALELTGEVITTHAIVRNGLTPVFCDIDPEDYTMDPDRIEELITDKTSAIIPVHVYGNVCDVDRIGAIAKKHDLKVIYDAAHTFGETYRGESVANFGDASIFSFHATKVYNTIEGGAVSFRADWMEHRLNCLKNFGIVDQEQGLKLPRYKEGLKPNYAYFPVIFDGFGADRDQVYEGLAAHHIFPRKYFYPLTNRFQCYEGRFSSEDTPVARFMADRVLTLPLYADLALEDVDRICALLREMA